MSLPSPTVLVVSGVSVLAVAGIAHIGTILTMPDRDRAHDAFARISALAALHTITVVRSDRDRATLPYSDAAMREALCRYDLRSGPLRITVEPFDANFISIGFHARSGTAYYGLNLPAGAKDALTVTVMTAAQIAEAEAGDAGGTGLQALRIKAPESEGFASFTVPDGDPELAERALATVVCRTATDLPDASPKS